MLYWFQLIVVALEGRTLTEKEKNIYVVELFAGVGGFRLALEKSSPLYKTVWANQWEPNKKAQHAYDCYIKHFGPDSCVNEDISKVKTSIPKHDLLVGGFPCQDYSVARTAAKGIEGKKGVLWWEINDIISANKPRYVLLENVDRLISSPGPKQRGRDFGIMLRCLNDMGYSVEWRIINAAEYGHPQRRRRVFIFASHNTTRKFEEYQNQDVLDIILSTGLFASTFPVFPATHTPKLKSCNLKDDSGDLVNFSDTFSFFFENSGFAVHGTAYCMKTIPNYSGKHTLLSEILEPTVKDEKYFITGDKLPKWEYLKGAKKEKRINRVGMEYPYSEGAIPFPDYIDRTARTMLTSEGSLNRSTHVINDLSSGRLRLLTPVECERINEFPDHWTAIGMPESWRHFTMGNALVVGVVKKLADEIIGFF
jgi:DNA (cytosine-5)-methyltransferase 1